MSNHHLLSSFTKIRGMFPGRPPVECARLSGWPGQFRPGRRCRSQDNPTTSRFSAGCRLAGDKVVESGIDRTPLDYHYFEDGLAAAYFLLNGQDRALRRGLLDNRRKGRLGHRQQRMILRRPSDVLQVSEYLLLRGPRRRCCVAYVLVEGIILSGRVEALRRSVDRQHQLAVCLAPPNALI